MESPLELFEHVYIDNKAERTLFLLHGTGGTKNDFLFLDTELENKYNLVGIQGNIRENGMARFFKRFSEGIFDEESIRLEAQKLQAFIYAWQEKKRIPAEQIYALGYSNGANMLLASLFLYPLMVYTVLLLHPMKPGGIAPKYKSLDQHKAFMSIGLRDHLISYSNQLELVRLLQQNNVVLEVREYSSGHEITANELSDVINYLK